MEQKIIYANNVNSKVVISVVKVADLFEAKLLPGENTVTIIGFTGKKYKCEKSKFIDTFTSIEGKRLSMISMRKNKPYLVARLLPNAPCLAVKLPKNSGFSMQFSDGRVAKPGSCVVIATSKLGLEDPNATSIDMSEALIIPEKVFNKTCIIKEVSPELTDMLVNTTFKEQIEKPVETKPLDMTEPKQQSSSRPVQQPQQDNRGLVVGTVRNKYSKDIVAYIVRGKQTYTVTEEQLIVLCKKNMVANATAVKNEYGTIFVRGVGCSLTELPSQFV